jgi:peptidoglycan-N-acetylglucosamine deacetylase
MHGWAIAVIALAAGAIVFGVIAWMVSSARSQVFVPTIFRGPATSGAVAFTFDDGPDATFTEQVLDVLREHGAKATFFVVGRAVEAHPELVRRMVADGHLVASHTFSHAHTFHFWRLRAMAEDIRRGIDAVARITGSAPRYFRPPQGIRVPMLRDALEEQSARPACVTWSVRGIDTVARSADAIVARIAHRLAPGAIVALHDGTEFGGLRSRAPTVRALPMLLGLARERGLSCVRLDDLLAPPRERQSETPSPSRS